MDPAAAPPATGQTASHGPFAGRSAAAVSMAGHLVRISDRNLNVQQGMTFRSKNARPMNVRACIARTFRLLSAFAGTVPVNTGDCCLKARRIPFGLLYIATLVVVIVLIPLIQFSGSQSPALAHRLSSATTLRMDKMRP